MLGAIKGPMSSGLDALIGSSGFSNDLRFKAIDSEETSYRKQKYSYQQYIVFGAQ